MEMTAGSMQAAFLMTILACFTSSMAFRVGKWSPAHATYYGADKGDDNTMGGACAYTNVWNDGYGVYTAALSDVLFNDGAACGSCYEIQCDPDTNDSNYDKCFSNSIYVTATNNCPQGSFGGWCDHPRQHFDLAVPAFTTIAEKVAGHVPIQYRRVPCQRHGGIRFFIAGNPNFQLMLIYNVAGAGDIKSAAIKGDNTAWQPMERRWGQNWQFGANLVGQRLSISVTNSDGARVVSHNVAPANWHYLQTFEGSQFSW